MLKQNAPRGKSTCCSRNTGTRKARGVGSNLPEQRNWIELGFTCYYLFSSNESQIN